MTKELGGNCEEGLCRVTKCQDVMEGETGQTFLKVKHRLLINPMKTSKP